MPRLPRPLPAGPSALLLTSDLAELHLPASRLRRLDLERVAHGVYRRRDVAESGWLGLGLPEPAHGVSPDHLRALLRCRPEAVLSHETAAHLHGIPQPWRPWLRFDPVGDLVSGTPPVHLTVPQGTRRVRRDGLMDHRRRLPDEHVTQLQGCRVTTVERTWLDLCALGSPWNPADLVAAGDHCVKHPWGEGRRLRPLATPASLRQALGEVGRFKGVRAARAALELVRVGADSPAETRVRLALLDAGLPEPELQVLIDPGDPFSPAADLGYRALRLAIQYDGLTHRTAEQQARDARRERYCLERGWRPVRVTHDDAREGFRALIALVRHRRRDVGADPSLTHPPAPPNSTVGARHAASPGR